MADLTVTVTDFTPQMLKIVGATSGAESFGVLFPNTAGVMNVIAHMYHKQWSEATMGTQLPGMPYAINSRGDYTKSLSVETDDDQHVNLDDIINILKDSMSARIYELLKRGDEADVVMSAHKNARFVEDCVREMAKRVINDFGFLPGDSLVTIKQTNEESIHQHDAYAERNATIAELKAELGEWR